MLDCKHNKTPLVVMLFANNALVISLRLYRFNDKLQMPICELCGKLIKYGLQKHQSLSSALTAHLRDRQCLQSEIRVSQVTPQCLHLTDVSKIAS